MYILIIFFLSFILFYFLLNTFFGTRFLINDRLTKVKRSKNGDSEKFEEPFIKRIFKPVMDKTGKIILKITPGEFVQSLQNKTETAGFPYGLRVRDWLNIQFVFVPVIILITLIFAIGILETRMLILTVFTEAGFGMVLPAFILGKKAKERQKKIRNSLPDVLDLLTVSVEAGLSFDAALIKVIDKMPGPIAEEFNNVLHEIKIGKQKRTALRDMAERIGVEDLTSFLCSVIQADQLGVSMGNVLRIQSSQMRQRRRLRAQEKAMKAPVKMVIPLVLFIFPTVFSVLIGPIIIKVLKIL